MPELLNEFSWSRSRDGSFQECRRKYFYHYYGAWGGWDTTAAEDVRRLYILKQLASRQQWASGVRRARRAIARTRKRSHCSSTSTASISSPKRGRRSATTWPRVCATFSA